MDLDKALSDPRMTPELAALVYRTQKIMADPSRSDDEVVRLRKQIMDRIAELEFQEGWRLRWGTVTTDWFDDEPGGPNFPAWTRFEVWVTRHRRRRFTVWMWRRHWAVYGPN